MSDPQKQPLQVIAFAGLAAFASLSWFSLIATPPLGRWALTVGVSLVLVVVLLALGRARGHAASVLGVAAAVAGLAGGLAAIGIPLRMLWPGAWGELAGQLQMGLAGISQVELPYEGADGWRRLGILAAAPLALTLAAALAFWPARRLPAGRRIAALAALLALYGVAVTWDAPGAELAHGLALLAFVALFLWLPSTPARAGGSAALAVAIAAAAALPAAARVDTSDPAIPYTQWRIFGEEDIVGFDWNHSYGPFDWSQRGLELFRVRADRPMYWRTSVLDSFSGEVWTSSGVPGSSSAGDGNLSGAAALHIQRHPRWVEEAEFGILGLETDLVPAPGTPTSIEGIATGGIGADGTTEIEGTPLTKGDSYSLTAYVPDPLARSLRALGEVRYPSRLERYTTLLLPAARNPAGAADPAAPIAPLVQVTAPLRGRERVIHSYGAPIAGRIDSTAYDRVRDLAVRLTRSADGPYAAIARLQGFLADRYVYEEDVPDHREPLTAFLFEDRAGYCQHFSGAMALMLRMIGIPARVVSGFAPGQPDGNGYVVRDTDAHSWVEVWFPRVGWVTVDPTPAAAPARTETLTAADPTGRVDATGRGRAFSIEQAAQSGPQGSGSRGEPESGRSPLPLLVLIPGLAIAVVLWRRRERLLSPAGAEAQLRELERALPALGVELGPGTTLLEVERRLAAGFGASPAVYVARLRENRYRYGAPRRPGPGERRALRRALVRSRGLRTRLRAIREIPPGGPK
ncbi:MAG: DUF3488 and transglutaminase-like domain-containing protein [Actinomycetota bacterium]|nr:DUF3488 and transglutaminase-like domain-containing protein [Actinomycetota bacterium]